MRSYCSSYNTTSSYSCKSVPVVVVWWFFLVCSFVLPTVLITTVEGRSTHPNRVTTPTGLGLLGATHSGHKHNNKNKSKTTHNFFLEPNNSKKKRKQKHALYQWGNLGSSENSYYDLVVRREPLFVKVERYLLVWTRRVTAWCHRHVAQLSHYLSQPHNILALSLKVFRYWVFYFFSRDCFQSLYDDRWHCERDPDDFFGSGGMWLTQNTAHKDVVRRRLKRGKRNRQWVGIGYTPRLVWLFGVLLRGTFACTSLHKVFNPKLTSWGAGTIFATKITHQEWISAFMIGWFFSTHYWSTIFGCDGPPGVAGGFEGVPITISRVRLFGNVPPKPSSSKQQQLKQ